MDCEVRFLPSNRRISVPAGTTLLDAARQAGLPVAAGCTGEGACARCAMKVAASGGWLEEESAAERLAKERNRTPGELRLSCQLTLQGDLTASASYW